MLTKEEWLNKLQYMHIMNSKYTAVEESYALPPKTTPKPIKEEKQQASEEYSRTMLSTSLYHKISYK